MYEGIHNHETPIRRTIVAMETYEKILKIAPKYGLRVILWAKQGEPYSVAPNLSDDFDLELNGDESDFKLEDNTGNDPHLYRGTVPEGKVYISIEGKDDLSQFWNEVNAL